MEARYGAGKGISTPQKSGLTIRSELIHLANCIVHTLKAMSVSARKMQKHAHAFGKCCLGRVDTDNCLVEQVDQYTLPYSQMGTELHSETTFPILPTFQIGM